MQQYSSKDTSLNQIPKLAKFLEITNETVLLDYGCGGYSKFQKLVEEKGGKFYGFDPFWKSEEENEIAMKCNPTIVTCANVLNVIQEETIIDNIVRIVSNFNCEVIFQVYEGNKTNMGSITKKGYQRNEKANCYMEYFTKYFDNVVKKGNVFFCKNDQ